MASRLAAGLFGRNLTNSAVKRVQQGSIRRLATASGENEFVAERLHHKEHAGSKYPSTNLAEATINSSSHSRSKKVEAKTEEACNN